MTGAGPAVTSTEAGVSAHVAATKTTGVASTKTGVSAAVTSATLCPERHR